MSELKFCGCDSDSHVAVQMLYTYYKGDVWAAFCKECGHVKVTVSQTRDIPTIEDFMAKDKEIERLQARVKELEVKLTRCHDELGHVMNETPVFTLTASHDTKPKVRNQESEGAMQALADQAQELGMGY